MPMIKRDLKNYLIFNITNMEFSGVKEKTLVLVKPDAIQRGLIGKIVSRFEVKGLKLVGMKMMTLNDAVLKDHYAHLVDKPFFGGLAKFMQSTPVIAICWEGLEVVDTVRKIVGITKARQAEAGSIRGDFAMSVSCNVIHASDSVENAMKEVLRFFSPEEIHTYDKSEYMHVYADDELNS